MRIARFHQRKIESGPNLTSLADVVMVILIFLMLTGSFGGGTHFLDSTFAGRAHFPPHVTDFSSVASTLDLFIENAQDGVGFTVRGVGIAPTSDVSLLTERLRLKAIGFTAVGAMPHNVQVVVHPRLDVRFQYVTAVYEAAARASFARIAFARLN